MSLEDECLFFSSAGKITNFVSIVFSSLFLTFNQGSSQLDRVSLIAANWTGISGASPKVTYEHWVPHKELSRPCSRNKLATLHFPGPNNSVI